MHKIRRLDLLPQEKTFGCLAPVFKEESLNSYTFQCLIKV